MKRWTLRVLLAATLAVGLGYLPYQAYGPKGVGRVLRLEREYDELVRQSQRLERDNRQLRVQIGELRRSRPALERVARDELGLVRSNDLVFQFEGE